MMYMPMLFVVFMLIAHGLSAQSLSDEETLGKHIFFDKTLSDPTRQACADCHSPARGWTTPEPGKSGGPHPGAVQQRSGARRPPTSAYVTFIPNFNGTSGGLFWDGRATGQETGDAAVDQALAPFFNSAEQNLTDVIDLCTRIQAAPYAALFEAVHGPISCDQAGAEQVHLSAAESIVAYEGSDEVNQFSSKFDAYVAGRESLTDQELLGMSLVSENCGCHTFTATSRTLFTNQQYRNIGTPKNPTNPVYKDDPGFVDTGLGGITGNSGDMGRFKVPTLRNVVKGNGKKGFMHNGAVKSLEAVVAFYNRGFEMGIEPEVAQNLSNPTNRLGGIRNLGLGPEDESAIVAFLHTLSDRQSVKPPTVGQLKR